MSIEKLLYVAVLPIVLAGCATAKFGDKTVEASLKKLQNIPDKVSVYVCRVDAFSGGGVGTEAFVNGRSIGALKPKTFAHTELPEGSVSVFLRRNGFGIHSGDSGSLELAGRAGEILIVWAGPAGAFIAPLTVDRFPTQAEGEACVKESSYAVP
jgi:hypothetical protein